MIYFGTRKAIDPVTGLPVKLGKPDYYWCPIDTNAVKFGNYPFGQLQVWHPGSTAQQYTYDPMLRDQGLPFMGFVVIEVLDDMPIPLAVMSGEESVYMTEKLTVLIDKYADQFLKATETATP